MTDAPTDSAAAAAVAAAVVSATTSSGAPSSTEMEKLRRELETEKRKRQKAETALEKSKTALEKSNAIRTGEYFAVRSEIWPNPPSIPLGPWIKCRDRVSRKEPPNFKRSKLEGDIRKPDEFIQSFRGALDNHAALGKSISTVNDKLIPIDVFGNAPTATDKAHLVPKARDDAMSWTYPTAAVLGIPWGKDGKVDEVKAKKGAVGSSKMESDGRETIFPGLRNLLCNIVRFAGQGPLFEAHPEVMFFPILDLDKGTRRWKGTGYDAIVLWTDKTVPLRLGMPAENLQETLDKGEINAAARLASELCKFLAHSVLQKGESDVLSYQKNMTEKAKVSEFFNKESKTVTIPNQLQSNPTKPLLKVSFAAHPNTEGSHPAPDPMLLGFKSVNNWCRLYEGFRMVAAAEPPEDDELSDEGQMNLQAYLEWADSKNQQFRHKEIMENIRTIEFTAT